MSVSAPSRSSRFGAIASSIVVPLALCQFVASYAGTNMNVAINNIAQDLGTSVRGVQSAITVFTLTMAALMIPGSKLTDIWGRRFCFLLGLAVYGSGALIAALAPSLSVLIVGYSLLEGIGSALMIPPIYILITVSFDDLSRRAQAFGAVSAAAGIGAAAGPLIGGLVTTSVSWRASFGLQILLVAVIFYLGHSISGERPPEPHPRFDLVGAVLSAVGLVLIVIGFLASGTYGWFTAQVNWTIAGTVIIAKGGISPVWIFLVVGVMVLAWFGRHIVSATKANRPALVDPMMLKSRRSNLGLSTQLMQWLVLQGSFFVISVFLQTIRGYSAIETGLILTPATFGILLSSALAGRWAKRFEQKTIVLWGFTFTAVGMCLLVLLVRVTSSIATFVPGLLFVGIGVGGMLTSSVNIVQGTFGDERQAEISGISRAVSNLGSSLGTALVGSILVSSLIKENRHFAIAILLLTAVALLGVVATALIPGSSHSGADDKQGEPVTSRPPVR